MECPFNLFTSLLAYPQTAKHLDSVTTVSPVFTVKQTADLNFNFSHTLVPLHPAASVAEDSQSCPFSF